MPKPTTRRFWLFKSEPSVFSLDDLRASTDQTTFWDGVRNYQARNFLRDDIMPGDGVLFYHSGTEQPGIVGTAVVTRGGYADHTQFEADHPHADPTSDPDDPRWYMVDIRFESAFPAVLTLAELKAVPALEGMELLRRGSRLSIQPVTAGQWKTILSLAGRTSGSR